MISFFTWHIFLQVGKTQDLPSKIWQTLRDAPVILVQCFYPLQELPQLKTL
jgi:hypothetical protein